MGKSHFEFLPTTPATQVEFSTSKRRDRPCWRCRFHLRWPPWRKHWQCMMDPLLRYIP